VVKEEGSVKRVLPAAAVWRAGDEVLRRGANKGGQRLLVSRAVSTTNRRMCQVPTRAAGFIPEGVNLKCTS